jgi:DNA-binding MarR family transcriptional regulator
MAIDNWVGILGKRGYIEVSMDPGGGRRRVARLTSKGVKALDASHHDKCCHTFRR